MTRPLKGIRKLYDINCEQHCRLRVGISEDFEKNVQDSKNMKKSA